MLQQVNIFAAYALAFATAYSAVREAVAVVGLAFRFSTLTFQLSFPFAFVGLYREQIADFAFVLRNVPVRRVNEFIASKLYLFETWQFRLSRFIFGLRFDVSDFMAIRKLCFGVPPLLVSE